MISTNGKHETNGKAPAPPRPALVTVVEIFRIRENTTAHVRALSDDYGGLITHWARGRSMYCIGDGCQHRACKSDRTWKGYTPVQVYSAERKKWAPAVLEITENLEPDLRGRWRRGQIWEMWMETDKKGKRSPVQGKLIEDHDPDKMPPPFDVVNVLRRLYHIDVIRLTTKNPMPPRLVLEESDGPAPAILGQRVDEERPMTDEEWQAKMKQLEERRRTPTERRNALPK